ncbi:pentatricopeptide repeat-containing protein At4g02750 [Cryptomeria japonica]|uniref:pentatricopeptide repeat-containing protein At4g02750 n=1 Tax=Cryptomeria japonica TaxID=3369 RepID=UPI0027DA10F7|nr:pentatricopeptide repeat-containing protein At4g02750 [Cryptomeria japonica]
MCGERSNPAMRMAVSPYLRNTLLNRSISYITNLKLRSVYREGCLKEVTHIRLTIHSCAHLQLMQPCNVLSEGKLIHSHANDSTLLQNTLINMYDKCGRVVDARKVFNQMTKPNVFSWNIIILTYRRRGHPEEALTLFQQMQRTYILPNHFTYSTFLPVCGQIGDLQQGMEVHQRIIESGFLSDVVVGNALIDMYAKCGCIHKARQLFDEMNDTNVVSWTAMITGYAQNGDLDKALRFFKEIPQRNVVTWNAMIVGYSQNGALHEALRLFEEMPQPNVVSWTAIIVGYAQNGLLGKALGTFKQMQLTGINPNSTTFAGILPAITKIGFMEQGIEIHEKIIESGVSDVMVVSALIDMYAKCGRVWKAHKLFDKTPQRNVFSWNALISGYAQNSVLDEALQLFKEMPHRNVVSWNAMIVGYTQNGFLEEALKLFEEMHERNVVSWTAIIAGYAQNGLVVKALEFFNQMQGEGIKADSSTFASILPACAKLGALDKGVEIHKLIIESGLLSDVVVVTALIDMYAKCGKMNKACTLFEAMAQRNAVSWNAIIAGYTQNGFVEKALEIFKQMQFTGVKPTSATFVSVLPAYAKLGALEQGIEIHLKIIEYGFLSDAAIANALMDMYAKCGCIQKARKLFDKMHNQTVVSWTVMIAGYAMHGFSKDAFNLFELMKHSGTNPDHVSFICVLFACSHAGLVDKGCKYFNLMGDFYIMPTMDHYVCIVDLLGRAGYLEESLNVILKMPISLDVVVWICLVGACRSHRNTVLGEFVATLLFELDPKNAAPYILLSNIYADMGKWGDVQNVRKLMKDKGIEKKPGCSWIEVQKTVHVFRVGDRSHPQTQEIYSKLEKLSCEMKVDGYIPEKRPLINDVEEEDKELFLCHHSEKLAIAFGLLNTSSKTTIRVVKNLRICGDCHNATKSISKIVAREIVVRDANRFHHFKYGQCSCGDYW